mgnify:CR=1 FL=1
MTEGSGSNAAPVLAKVDVQDIARDPLHKPFPHYCSFDFGECRTDLLPLLYQISRLASESGSLQNILGILLQLMKRHLHMVRGMVTLYDPEIGRAHV